MIHKKIAPIMLIFIFVLFSGFGCKCTPAPIKDKMKPVTLQYWGVFDSPENFTQIIANYKKKHPFVNIQYRKLRYEEYEKELLDAFLENRGPDIFSVHNIWVRHYEKRGLIGALPPQVSMVYPVEKGTLKKEIVPEIRTSNTLTVTELKRNFIDVVHDDVIIKNKIYGLPLSVDTLVMFYNKDLLNNANITSPPEFWNQEFQRSVVRMTKQNSRGEIIQSGVAMGGGHNISRASDILSVLMMQNGAEMVSGNTVTFHSAKSGGAQFSPGLDALRFYTDFSDPSREVYSWNYTLENSFDLFLRNKVGIMFGYSYMLPDIRSKAPRLNFAVAKLPQIENSSNIVNFANYWVNAVSSRIATNPNNTKQGADYAKQKYDTAWSFVQFMASEDQAKIYLESAKKPTALRSLIETQKADYDLGIFAEQLLTSKSWYKGYQPKGVEKIMEDMTDNIIKGEEAIGQAIANGAKKVQQTLIK